MLARLISILVPPLCVACGADAGRGAPMCRECRAQMHAGGARRIAVAGSRSGRIECFAAFPYDGPAGALVRGLKFGGRRALADVMAANLVACAPVDVLAGCVVPVPVHPRHRRRRGLDHAGELAAAVADRAGLPLVDCLVRRGDPTPQVGRGRRERISGPVGSIVVRERLPVPACALLVDDVVTTGATIAACAQALEAAGTERVAALGFARTAAR
jgi:predicted amidophosphoribosyltransferase